MKQAYNQIVAPFKKRQTMKILISALVAVMSIGVGAGTSLDISGALTLVGMVAFFYFMMTGFSALILGGVRKKSHRALAKQNLLEEAMADLEHADRIQVDDHCFGLTEKYLCLPHGVILEVKKMAWVYLQVKRMRYMYIIPAGTIRTCQIKMVDGTETAAFFGKLKDDQSFKTLLAKLLQYQPRLLIGHTMDNQHRYTMMVNAHKATVKAAER